MESAIMFLLILACVSYLSYQGRLVDNKGKPVSNAQIEIQSVAIICHSDGQGYFATPKKLLPEKEYTYTISSLGYQSLDSTIRLEKKGNIVKDIVLYNKEVYLPYRKRNLDIERKE